jgi:hypothetical protein
MNRYILGALLAVITVLTAYGINTSRDIVRQVSNASREAVSSTPTAANEGLTGIESAGQNITRLTSAEGLARSQDTPSVTEQVQPTDTADTVEPATEEFPPQELEAAPPVAPAPEPSNQDAIPALW